MSPIMFLMRLRLRLGMAGDNQNRMTLSLLDTGAQASYQEASSLMSEQKAKRGAGRSLTIALVIFFVVVVLYALSFGPAILLNKKGKISVQTLELVYFPLNIASQAIPGASGLLEKYVMMWVGD